MIISPITFSVSCFSSHLRLAHLMRLGTVRVRSGKTCTGVYQGSLLLSTPGQPHGPGSQAVLRCLIVYPDRVNAGGHAKGRPRRWYSRSVVGSPIPNRSPRSWVRLGEEEQRNEQAFTERRKRMLWSLLRRRYGVRCGTLVCSGGSPYCWYEITKEHSLVAVFLIVASEFLFF